MPENYLLEMQLCKRPELILSRDQKRTTAKSTVQSAVAQVTMPSEGSEYVENTVLTPVTRGQIPEKHWKLS